MNWIIKASTIKCYYSTYKEVQRYLDNIVRSYNFGRRLKTLKGLTFYAFTCKTYSSLPKCFTFNALQRTQRSST